MPERLLCLRAPGLHVPQFDPAKGELPQRLLVLPWGVNQTTQGPVVCNETTAKVLLSNNAALGYDRPILDFEHSSEPQSPTYRGEPAKIAGHGPVEVVRGEGVYMLMSHWTPEGTESAGGGHYPDLSPVVKVNAKNEVVALKSVALCRHGATPGLVFLSAETPSQDAPTKAKAPSLQVSKSPSLRLKLLTTMDKAPTNAEELLAALRSLLNQAADASPEDVMTALSAALSEGGKKTEKTEMSAEMKQLSANLQTLSDSIKAQGETIKLLTANHETSERGNILAAAAREGKQVPKMAANLPIDQLKLLCAELPVTVPMHPDIPEGVRMLSADGKVVEHPEMTQIDALMGVTAEDRAKYLA